MENGNEIIRLGISSCLLGEKVRWDGGHKENRYARETLGKYFAYVPVCPEVDVGMGVPREAVHLRGNKNSQQLVGTQSGKDWTAKMLRFSEKKFRELSSLRLSGFIFKQGSPSCGVGHIPVYSESEGKLNSLSRGLFARSFIARFPWTPVEEEGRLEDIHIRENFIVRVFGFHRLQNFFQGRFSKTALMNFHSHQKILLLAHSKRHYDALESLMAESGKFSAGQLKIRYSEGFMEGLTCKSTPKKNTDALLYTMRFLKKHLTGEENRKIRASIQDYRNGRSPLIIPITRIRHHAEVHNIAELLDQVYLNPHPQELMLRYHA